MELEAVPVGIEEGREVADAGVDRLVLELDSLRPSFARVAATSETRSPIGIWCPSARKSGPIASGETSASVTFPSSYSTQRSLEFGFRLSPSVLP